MKAYFAGGCFWCITPIFKIYGVDSAVCGYSGGEEPDPSYERVKKQKTGHRETIELTFDPETVSYETLLDIFLSNIDPFDGEGQFIDRGRSYSPAIFYQTKDEERSAREKLAALSKAAGRQTKVAVESFKSFYPAEEEHQDFYLKNPAAFANELKEREKAKKK